MPKFFTVIYLKFKQRGKTFGYFVKIANGEDPDQTIPLGAVWSGCALFCLKTLGHYGNLLKQTVNRWDSFIDWLLSNVQYFPILSCPIANVSTLYIYLPSYATQPSEDWKLYVKMCIFYWKIKVFDYRSQSNSFNHFIYLVTQRPANFSWLLRNWKKYLQSKSSWRLLQLPLDWGFDWTELHHEKTCLPGSHPGKTFAEYSWSQGRLFEFYQGHGVVYYSK